MFLLVLAAVVTSASQPSGSEGCVYSTARALEPSGEPARDVAAAVAAECDIRKGAPADSLAGQMSEANAQAYRRLDEEFAIVFVMRLRACRRTPGCNLAEVRAP